MAPGEYISSANTIGSTYIYASTSNYYRRSYCAWYDDAMEMLRRARHREFVASLIKKQQVERLDDKSISLLTRSVRPSKVMRSIRQPAWRAGRWKSLT